MMWSETESNRRHGDFQSPALPTELPDHVLSKDYTYLIAVRNMSIIKNSFFLIFFFTMLLAVPGRAQRTADAGWEYFFKRGMNEYKAELYEDACDSMKKALARKPELYEAANIIADIRFIQGDRYEAIDYYTISLSINDSQPLTHNKLGELLEYYIKYNEALEHYTRGHELDPGNTRILINLSRVNRKLGNTAVAEKWFAECRDRGMAESADLVMHAGRIKSVDTSGAIRLYLEAIRVNPAHSEAYMGLADCYRQTGENEKAAAILEDLKIINPGYAPLYIYLGSIYFNDRLKGNTRKYYINLAIKNLEEAIRLQPDNADLYLELSRIMEMLGERERADRLLETADRLIRQKK